MSIYYSVSHLGHFSTKEVHDLYKLRVDTFVAEQGCAYEEIDDIDARPTTLHITARGGEKLLGCARVFIMTLDDGTEVVHFGRFALHPETRGTGVAGEIIDNSIRLAHAQFPGLPVCLDAQEALESYYEGHGFKRYGDTFNKHGHPHVPMVHESTPVHTLD